VIVVASTYFTFAQYLPLSYRIGMGGI